MRQQGQRFWEWVISPNHNEVVVDGPGHHEAVVEKPVAPGNGSWDDLFRDWRISPNHNETVVEE
ncbi:hypothetical protein ACQP1P_29035 [Dactylosporangium sp. CA-052675]|uniref:hypothetical protein n=1 Tax=Dactylosporangium sp. CA-052675 TaxID=3239927 RepID=UPI003D9290E5